MIRKWYKPRNGRRDGKHHLIYPGSPGIFAGTVLSGTLCGSIMSTLLVEVGGPRSSQCKRCQQIATPPAPAAPPAASTTEPKGAD